MRTRNKKIQCWLSEKEYKAFDKAVKKSPLSKSDYIRNLILGYAPIEMPREVFETRKILFEVCNTLKDIAERIDAHGTNADEYYKAYYEFREITNKIFEAVTRVPKLKELKIEDENEEISCAIHTE